MLACECVKNAIDDDIITRYSTGAQSDKFPHWLSERDRLALDFMKKGKRIVCLVGESDGVVEGRARVQ